MSDDGATGFMTALARKAIFEGFLVVRKLELDAQSHGFG